MVCRRKVLKGVVPLVGSAGCLSRSLPQSKSPTGTPVPGVLNLTLKDTSISRGGDNKTIDTVTVKVRNTGGRGEVRVLIAVKNANSDETVKTLQKRVTLLGATTSTVTFKTILPDSDVSLSVEFTVLDSEAPTDSPTTA